MNHARRHIRHRWMESLLNESINDEGSRDAVANNMTLVDTAASSSTTTTATNSSVSLTVLGSLVIVGFCILLILCVWYITWCTLRFYRQKQLRRDILVLRAIHLTNGTNGHSHTGNNEEEHSPWYVDDTPTLERIQRRYETIEHWMVTKRAQEHTACCSTIQAQRCYMASSSSSSSGSCNGDDETTSDSTSHCVSTINTEGEEVEVEEEDTNHTNSIESSELSSELPVERDCPICMSTLETDQILSWSSNPNCIHVYHHECIKEWLLRHKECCLCKQTFLPIDAKNSKQSLQLNKNGTLPTYIHELSQQFRAAVATSYYCVEHGLVRIPELFYCTASELEQLERHIIDNTIAPIDLIPLRGNYHQYETSNTTTGSIDNTVNNNNHVAMESIPTNTLDTTPDHNTAVPVTNDPVLQTVPSIGDTAA